MPSLCCPNSVVLQFPESVYENYGSLDVLPRFLSVVDAEKLTSVQFFAALPCWTDFLGSGFMISSGPVCGEVQVRVIRADFRFRSCTLRKIDKDPLSETSSKCFLQS